MSFFREPSGQVSQAQFHAFTDTWSWADAADTYHQFIDTCPNVAVVELMEALHSFLKHSPMMAYLAMMAPRHLVNKVFGKNGTLAKEFDSESEREGYRDLFAGIVGAFRNPSGHRLVDPNPHEGGAYILLVNLLLSHLERLGTAHHANIEKMVG